MLKLLAIVAVAGALMALALFEAEPLVERAPVPDRVAAVQAHAVVRRALDVRRTTDPAPVFALEAGELESVLALAARLVPGLRLSGRFDDTALHLGLSQHVPLPGDGVWLNGSVTVLPSDAGLRLGALRIGALSLPPQLSLSTGLWLADLVTGQPGLGALAASLHDMRIGPDGLSTVVAMPLETRKAISQGLQRAARSVAVSADVDAIDGILAEIDAAQREGALPREGSALPYLRFAIEAAATRADGMPPPLAAGSALIALAIACGERHLQTLTGTTTESPAVDQFWACRRTTLGGRTDLRQHFTVSAALKAAAELGFAVRIGEFKELYDSRPRGSGFSFDDLAANRAGIAFATLLLGTSPEKWPDILAAVTAEDDLLPEFRDLPSGLTEAQFRARFGSIDSAEFAELVAEIDRRIDALPLHAARRPGGGSG